MTVHRVTNRDLPQPARIVAPSQGRIACAGVLRKPLRVTATSSAAAVTCKRCLASMEAAAPQVDPAFQAQLDTLVNA